MEILQEEHPGDRLEIGRPGLGKQEPENPSECQKQDSDHGNSLKTRFDTAMPAAMNPRVTIRLALAP